MLTFSKGGTTNIQRFFSDYGWPSSFPVESTGSGDSRHTRINIASGYGAKFKRWFKITRELHELIVSKMSGVTSAESERAALVGVLAIMEKEFSAALEIEDRAGIDMLGSGDKTQLDCVDEAWNATVVLIWLKDAGLLRYHGVREPLAKWGLFKWNHYAAIINDNDTDTLWAIDGGVRSGGGPPLIIEASKWYE